MNYFQKLYGFKEKDANLLEIIKKYFIHNKKDHTLISTVNKRKFICGNFELLSLGELRKNIDLNSDLIKSTINKENNKISVKNVQGDVSNFHNNPTNKFATFQGASQFNCLEFASQNGSPENGITCYAMDKTQGPCCAITCSPGTVIRNYFAFDPKNKKTSIFDFINPAKIIEENQEIEENPDINEPQTKDSQINCLSRIDFLLKNNNEKYFTVKNGYTNSTKTKLENFNKFLTENPKILHEMEENFISGVQFDTEVVAPNFGNNIVFTDEVSQKIIVTQVYNSAISVSYSDCSWFKWEKFACFILECAYEFCLYCGVINALKHGGESGSRKVYLTNLGGGVFGNKMSAIKNAILKALVKFDGVGLEVYIVGYGAIDPEMRNIESEFQEKREKLNKFMDL